MSSPNAREPTMQRKMMKAFQSTPESDSPRASLRTERQMRNCSRRSDVSESSRKRMRYACVASAGEETITPTAPAGVTMRVPIGTMSCIGRWYWSADVPSAAVGRPARSRVVAGRDGQRLRTGRPRSVTITRWRTNFVCRNLRAVCRSRSP